MTMESHDLFIDGKFVPAKSGETFEVWNPAKGEAISRVAKAGAADVDTAVRAARRAFDEGPWPWMTAAERARYLFRIAALIRERADEVARRARRQRSQQQLELAVGRLIAFAMRDRELARRLDEIEQRLAALLAHELADELAEPVHVLAQCTVLLREEDVGADRPGRR